MLPWNLASLLKMSRVTLQTIKLDHLGIRTTPRWFPYEKHFLLFPKLESLELASGTDFVYKYFRQVAAPLKKLFIDYEQPFEDAVITRTDNSSAVCNCLIDLLIKNASGLVEFRFDYDSADPPQSKFVPRLDFSRLEKMEFGSDVDYENFALLVISILLSSTHFIGTCLNLRQKGVRKKCTKSTETRKR